MSSVYYTGELIDLKGQRIFKAKCMILDKLIKKFDSGINTTEKDLQLVKSIDGIFRNGRQFFEGKKMSDCFDNHLLPKMSMKDTVEYTKTMLSKLKEKFPKKTSESNGLLYSINNYYNQFNKKKDYYENITTEQYDKDTPYYILNVIRKLFWCILLACDMVISSTRKCILKRDWAVGSYFKGRKGKCDEYYDDFSRWLRDAIYISESHKYYEPWLYPKRKKDNHGDYDGIDYVNYPPAIEYTYLFFECKLLFLGFITLDHVYNLETGQKKTTEEKDAADAREAAADAREAAAAPEAAEDSERQSLSSHIPSTLRNTYTEDDRATSDESSSGGKRNRRLTQKRFRRKTMRRRNYRRSVSRKRIFRH